MKKKKWNPIGWILLAVVLYLLISLAVVPSFQKKLKTPLPEIRVQDTADAQERVLCIDDNEEALIRRLQVIESAQKELIFTTYSFKKDESGLDVMAALLHAAERGVNVRILVDGFSNLTDLHSSAHFKALAASPNVTVKFYNKVNPFQIWTTNYRMHDKYVVADDRVYILGGRNTRNVSLGAYQEQHDVDRDVLVYCENPDARSSLGDVKAYFESVWALPCSQTVAGGKHQDEESLMQLRQRYEKLQEQYPQAFEIPDWHRETVATGGIALLTNPIEPENKEPVLWNQLCSVMENGKDILVQTPYVVCNRTMYEDLTRLNQNGRQVGIITNAVETGANPSCCADYINQKGKLRNTGCRIYEHAGEHSVHAKTVLVDDRISIIGSFNFDMRSAYLDTEMMLVIDCPELNAQLRETMADTMAQSRWVAEGETVLGSRFQTPEMGLGKHLLYGLLRVLTLPVRHLL